MIRTLIVFPSFNRQQQLIGATNQLKVGYLEEMSLQLAGVAKKLQASGDSVDVWLFGAPRWTNELIDSISDACRDTGARIPEFFVSMDPSTLSAAGDLIFLADTVANDYRVHCPLHAGQYMKGRDFFNNGISFDPYLRQGEFVCEGFVAQCTDVNGFTVWATKNGGEVTFPASRVGDKIIRATFQIG